jgi:anti-anti-sigma factor
MKNRTDVSWIAAKEIPVSPRSLVSRSVWVRPNALQRACNGLVGRANLRRPRIHEADYNHDRVSLTGEGISRSSSVEEKCYSRGVVGLQISIREIGDVTVVDLRGRSTIDDGSSELLSSQLRELVASGVRNLLLNLVNLIQVDSSGVSVIVGTYVSLKRQGGDLKLLCPCGRVLEVLTVFRLLNTIPTFEDETQALASFRPRSQSAAS